jgi:uncharacterized repeat protein (TIGR01451 family)
MLRPRPSGLTRYFRDLIRKTFSGRKRSVSRNRRPGLKFESLEGRQLLASDLGAINGIVTLQGIEVAGATVNLYLDDGDGIFEPGAEASGPIATTTDVTGAYLFERLAAGNYWIEQPAQTVGTDELGLSVSPLIEILAEDAEGIPGITVIDDFADDPEAEVTSTSGTQSNHFDHLNALGDERDMTVTLKSGTTAPSVSLTSAGNQLVFDSSIDAQGVFNVVYDGDDDDTTLPPSVTTMPSQDLTDGGLNTSIKIEAQADHAGATVRLRVYTSATNFSDSALFTIPDNTGPEDFVFHFSQFTDAGGTGADFEDVRALELVIETNTDATDGLVTLLGAFSPTVFSQDFANEVDLSVTKTVDDAAPAVGQDVTFTITVSNSTDSAGATDIQITDQLPTGLTLVSSNPSVGTFTAGVWTIDSLAAGATATLEIVATVTVGTPLDNTATITAVDQFDFDTANDTDTVTVDAVITGDLSLTITPDTASPAIGEDVTFTVTLANGGPDAATNIVVTDVIPIGLTLQSSTAEAGTTYASNTWTIPTLASGEDVTLTIVLQTTDNDPHTYSAQVTASDQADGDSTPNDGEGDDFDSATIDAAATDLSLTITPDTATPAIGEDVTFTVTLANAGPDAATNIVVTDIIPAGLTLQSSTAETGTTYAANTWTIPTLASGEDVTLTIVLRATNGDPLSYSAQVTDSDQTDTDSTPNDGEGDDFDSASIDAVPTADLSLTITPETAAPALNGDTTFTVTLTNGGPDAATNVVVTDVIPTGLTIQSSTAGAGTTYASNTWTIPTLASGASVTLTMVLRATTADPLTYSAQVTDSDQADSDSTPNDGAGDDFDSATVDVPASADLSLAITPPSATPAVGADATFTVTLSNGGPDTATNIVVTDVIPAGLTLQSATAASGTTYASNVWNIPTLASGANVTLTLVLRPTVTTALTYTTQVTASGASDPDSTPNDNTGDDRATATIDAPDTGADLSVTQTASSNTPNFGANVTFTITVANAGPNQATGVVVTDLLPTGLVFVSSTPSQGSYVAGTGVWTVGSINSGANATLSIVARVNTTAAVDNVAQVTASGVPDPDSTPNDNTGDDRDVETIDAPAAADLRLAKTVNGSLVNVGQQVTFRLTLTNDGPDQATGVTVSDQLPAGLTFVSATASVGTYDNVTGVWTVGSLNNGASATLDIVATLATAGAKTNTAQITASGVFDPDSTPNDNAGDDRATVQVSSTRLSKRRFLAR